MAHFWVQKSSSGSVAPGDRDTTWDVLPLDAEEALLLPPSGTAAALLLRSRSTEGDLWLLFGITPGDVVLNGQPLRSGIRVLADRDEIHLHGAGRMFFSTERLAVAQPCTSKNPDLRCPRCRRPIKPESSAVACPNCAIWYHQTETLPCWTHASTCALCQHPSDLNGKYRWTPEEL